jgi:23S rRNA pseudouridine1911/1915/1917 synthase
MLEILEIRKDWIVAVKPFGVLSEDPAPSARPDPVPASGKTGGGEKERGMPSLIRQALTEQGAAFEDVYPVHRLDRTTEGLTVYALTKKGAAALSGAVARGKTEKIYAAYLTPSPDLPSSGEMRDFLFFDRKRDKAFILDPEKAEGRRGAKEAALRYELTDRFEWRGREVARARVELMTGRTHQIRAQFGARRSPLIGDGKYGSRVNYKGPSLFAVELAFPWDGGDVRFRIERGLREEEKPETKAEPL